nr:hypothetical protein Itr_chr05CG13710 [Ipomoea trifida]
MRTTKLKHILGVRLVHRTRERRVRMRNVMVQTVNSAQLSASTSSCSGTSPPVPSGLSMNSRWGRTDGSRERSTWLRWNGRGVEGRGRVLTFGEGVFETFLELRVFLPVSPGLGFFVTSIHVPKRRFS